MVMYDNTKEKNAGFNNDSARYGNSHDGTYDPSDSSSPPTSSYLLQNQQHQNILINNSLIPYSRTLLQKPIPEQQHAPFITNPHYPVTRSLEPNPMPQWPPLLVPHQPQLPYTQQPTASSHAPLPTLPSQDLAPRPIRYDHHAIPSEFLRSSIDLSFHSIIKMLPDIHSPHSSIAPYTTSVTIQQPPVETTYRSSDPPANSLPMTHYYSHSQDTPTPHNSQIYSPCHDTSSHEFGCYSKRQLTLNPAQNATVVPTSPITATKPVGSQHTTFLSSFLLKPRIPQLTSFPRFDPNVNKGTLQPIPIQNLIYVPHHGDSSDHTNSFPILRRLLTSNSDVDMKVSSITDTPMIRSSVSTKSAQMNTDIPDTMEQQDLTDDTSSVTPSNTTETGSTKTLESFDSAVKYTPLKPALQPPLNTLPQEDHDIVNFVGDFYNDSQELRDFATFFRTKRLILGYTQKQVAMQIETMGLGRCCRSTLSRFERLFLSRRHMITIRPTLLLWLQKDKQDLPVISDGVRCKKTTTRKREHYRKTPAQVQGLLDSFKRNKIPTTSQKQQLAVELELSPQIISQWFQNQRKRERQIFSFRKNEI